MQKKVHLSQEITHAPETLENSSTVQAQLGMRRYKQKSYSKVLSSDPIFHLDRLKIPMAPNPEIPNSQ